MAASGWIEDRWLKKRKDPVTGKRERTDLWGTSTKRYRVCGIPGVRKRSFATLDEAKEWKNATIAAMKKREFVDERDGEILLGEYITDEWWPSCEYDDTTSGRMKQRIFKQIVGTALGQTQLYVIGDDHLRAWRKELKCRGLSFSTKELIFHHIGGTSHGQAQIYVIGYDHLRAWKKELKSRGLADSTMELIWINLGSIFQSALGKRLPKNPCRVAEKKR